MEILDLISHAHLASKTRNGRKVRRKDINDGKTRKKA